MYCPYPQSFHICKSSVYSHTFYRKTADPLSFLFLVSSYCTGPFTEIHQEFQQITELSVFDQQIFRRGLLQRNNFPLHFLSWTKTPFKWMAFAHSLRPQLAVLLPTLVLWSQSRQAEDEGQRWLDHCERDGGGVGCLHFDMIRVG